MHILQIRKLRHRMVKSFVQCHAAEMRLKPCSAAAVCVHVTKLHIPLPDPDTKQWHCTELVPFESLGNKDSANPKEEAQRGNQIWGERTNPSVICE